MAEILIGAYLFILIFFPETDQSSAERNSLLGNIVLSINLFLLLFLTVCFCINFLVSVVVMIRNRCLRRNQRNDSNSGQNNQLPKEAETKEIRNIAESLGKEEKQHPKNDKRKWEHIANLSIEDKTSITPSNEVQEGAERSRGEDQVKILGKSREEILRKLQMMEQMKYPI